MGARAPVNVAPTSTPGRDRGLEGAKRPINFETATL